MELTARVLIALGILEVLAVLRRTWTLGGALRAPPDLGCFLIFVIFLQGNNFAPRLVPVPKA